MKLISATVSIEPHYFRSSEVEIQFGEIIKSKQKLGWVFESAEQGIYVEIDAQDLPQANRHSSRVSVCGSSHQTCAT